MSEKAGVLNVGIEGMMLMGAFFGFLGAWQTESLWIGFLYGIVAGMVVAAIMALLCVRIGLSQIVVGIGLTLGAEGLTALLHYVHFSRTYPRLPAVETLAIPGLSSIPVIGPGLFERPPIVYLAILITFVLAFLYR